MVSISYARHDTLHTSTCVIIITQLITVPAGTPIGSNSVITNLCTSTIISLTLIDVYKNNTYNRNWLIDIL